jgi:AmmeMemoRadiSam system protein A
MARAGVFVTLLRQGELRGCIGHVEADTPLAPLTGRMARAAALDDPRFPPLAPHELPDLDVEVSVLGAPTAATAAALVPGVHGVVVSRGTRRGVLLPEVATAFGWSVEELLDAACAKAGLEPGAWRRPDTQVERFTTQKIRGGGRPPA